MQQLLSNNLDGDSVRDTKQGGAPAEPSTQDRAGQVCVPPGQPAPLGACARLVLVLTGTCMKPQLSRWTQLHCGVRWGEGPSSVPADLESVGYQLCGIPWPWRCLRNRAGASPWRAAPREGWRFLCELWNTALGRSGPGMVHRAASCWCEC